MIFKILFLFSLVFWLLYLNFRIREYFILNNDLNYLILTNIIWVLLWLFLIYIFVNITNWLIKFFYWIEIITETKVYKFNIWIFSTDDISVINMFNIQEVKSVREWFFKVLFNISDIYLIEQRDKMTIIHYVDDGATISNLISKFKEKLIILPENK